MLYSKNTKYNEARLVHMSAVIMMKFLRCLPHNELKTRNTIIVTGTAYMNTNPVYPVSGAQILTIVNISVAISHTRVADKNVIISLFFCVHMIRFVRAVVLHDFHSANNLP